MLKNGCGQPGHGTLKLTVSQNWTDKTTWFFCMLVQMQEGWKLIQSFLNGPCQKWQWLLSSWNPKTCILKINIWIELNILMLVVMQKFLVRLISYSLTFKCRGSAVFVILVFTKLMKMRSCSMQKMEGLFVLKFNCI